MNPRTRQWLLAGVVALLVIAFGPEMLVWVGHDHVPKDDEWLATANARTSLVQLIVGIGALGGAVYAARTFALTRRNQQNERFAKAVDNLGSVEARVRIGGVHTLQMLAVEQSAFWDPVDDLLCSLVRARLAGRGQADTKTIEYQDVQTALRALGVRPRDHGSPLARPLDLSGLNLSGFVLTRANLHRADLSQATLTAVEAVDTTMSEAKLVGIKITQEANFAGAVLTDADATEAIWGAASLLNATVDRLVCERADLAAAKDLTAAQIAAMVGTPTTVPSVTIG